MPPAHAGGPFSASAGGFLVCVALSTLWGTIFQAHGRKTLSPRVGEDRGLGAGPQAWICRLLNEIFVTEVGLRASYMAVRRSGSCLHKSFYAHLHKTKTGSIKCYQSPTACNLSPMRSSNHPLRSPSAPLTLRRPLLSAAPTVSPHTPAICSNAAQDGAVCCGSSDKRMRS